MKKNIKNIKNIYYICYIILLVCMIISLCACGKNSADSENESGENAAAENENVTEENADVNPDGEPAETVNEDLKFRLDSYESFLDEYINFLNQYPTAGDTEAMLAGASDYTARYNDIVARLDEIDISGMSNADLEYYIAVNARLTEKFNAIAAKMNEMAALK